MNSDQAKNVALVYRRFIASEKFGICGGEGMWDGLDDYMDQLEYLDDNQLHREADVVLMGHKQGKPDCGQNHTQSECFISQIVDAVDAILEQYKETGNLHKNNKYILQYYLAISQAGMVHLS